MDQLEMEFTKGFNHGYLFAKYEPKLLDKLAKSIPADTNEYCNGIISGKQEFEQEKIKEKSVKEIIKKDHQKRMDKGRDK